MRGTWRHVPSARHSRAVLSSLADAISPPAVAAALHTAAHGCQKLRISVDMHSAEDACRLRHSRSEMMCVNGFSQEVQRLAENMETAPVDESCVAAERGDWVAAHGPDLQRAIVRRRHKTELGHQAEAPAPQRTIPSVISAHKLPTRFTCHSPAGTLHHIIHEVEHTHAGKKADITNSGPPDGVAVADKRLHARGPVPHLDGLVIGAGQQGAIGQHQQALHRALVPLQHLRLPLAVPHADGPAGTQGSHSYRRAWYTEGTSCRALFGNDSLVLSSQGWEARRLSCCEQLRGPSEPKQAEHEWLACRAHPSKDADAMLPSARTATAVTCHLCPCSFRIGCAVAVSHTMTDLSLEPATRCKHFISMRTPKCDHATLTDVRPHVCGGYQHPSPVTMAPSG